MKHTQTFNDFLNEEKVNEASNITLKDEYAKQIWSGHQAELLELVNKINRENYDHGSSEIICDGLAEIFAALGNVDGGPLYNGMNK